MKSTLYYIPHRARKIMLALASTLVSEPADLVIHNKENELIHRAEMVLREFPKLNRIVFIFGFYIFDWLAIFLGFGLHRFVHLKPDNQKKYVHIWETTQSTMMREFFKGVRGLVMICYFSHPDIYTYIDYDPKKHVAERIKLREEILKSKQV